MNALWYTRVIGLSLIFALVVTSIPFVYAEESSSGSFQAKNTEIGTLGGSSGSASFDSVSSGGQIPTGTATSTTFILNAGPLYFESFTPRSSNWRWYGDENNETPVTALASENVAPSDVASGDIVKLRISVAEKANIGSANIKFHLQFATTSDFSQGALFVEATSTCTIDSVWCYANGAGIDNDIISTAVISDSDACVASVGVGCGTHNESGTTTSSFTQAASSTTEYEFTIEESGAVANTAYFFRLVDVNGSSTVPTHIGKTYPSLVTEGATLTFTIGGVASSTAIDGVTTDVDTTADAVPFGHVFFSTPTEAAQRLTVTTNADQGYRVYAFQRQPLLAPGAEIEPVQGTNPSPVAWSSGCPPESLTCYGYHTSEDVLAGGSTRFAANDTFAQFESTPYEVAFAGGPAASRYTDVVYKIEARSGAEGGVFESSLVYIVVPVF